MLENFHSHEEEAQEQISCRMGFCALTHLPSTQNSAPVWLFLEPEKCLKEKREAIHILKCLLTPVETLPDIRCPPFALPQKQNTWRRSTYYVFWNTQPMQGKITGRNVPPHYTTKTHPGLHTWVANTQHYNLGPFSTDSFSCHVP
jgi:hypothetical protein